MKTTKTGCFQGDVCFRRVDKLPVNAVEVKPAGKPIIVAHSETGHHHSIDNELANAVLFTTSDPLVRYLRVKGYADVVHERDYDTHETVRLDSGDAGEVIFEIRRQEELRPDGWARVED